MRPYRKPLAYYGFARNDTEEAELLSLAAAVSLEDVGRVRDRYTSRNRPATDRRVALQLQAEEPAALDVRVNSMHLTRNLGEMDGWATDDSQWPAPQETPRAHRDFDDQAVTEGKPSAYEAGSVHSYGNATSFEAAVPAPSRMEWSSKRGGGRNSHADMPPSPLQKSTAKEPTDACVVCMEEIRGEVVTAPCGHPYDVQCLVDLIEAATVDETLFPPACCQQPFDLDGVWVYLDDKLQKRVEKKAREFGTQNRVYCHQPTCSTFLGPATPSATRMLCTTCWAHTCGHCKGPSHDRTIQCMSTDDESVVALAEQSGWRRCPGCGQFVELSSGCNHMTCRCRYQFCYVCRAPWKTCGCAKWGANNLLDLAEHRVNARHWQEEDYPRNEEAPVIPTHYGHGVPPYGNQPPVYGQGIPFYGQGIPFYLGEAERLRNYQVCAHHWRYCPYKPGTSYCGCGNPLNFFIYHCDWCYTWACARCVHNRWI